MKSCLVILNPKSGDGRASEAFQKLNVRAVADGVELKVVRTEREGHACEVTRDCDLSGFDAIISVGGDGTLHEVLNGVLSREDGGQCPVGVLPAGTGNSLMKDLGCQDVDQALEDMFSGGTMPLDVFEARVDGKRYFGFHMIGVGLPAMVNHYAEKARHFETYRYDIGVLKAFFRYRKVGFRLQVGDEEESIASDFIIAANTRFVGSGMEISPEARLDDGVIDLMFLSSFNRFSLIPLFWKLNKGTHLDDSRVTLKRVGSFSVTAPSKQELNIDGEQRSFRELEVSVLPWRVRLLHSSTTSTSKP